MAHFSHIHTYIYKVQIYVAKLWVGNDGQIFANIFFWLYNSIKTNQCMQYYIRLCKLRAKNVCIILPNPEVEFFPLTNN